MMKHNYVALFGMTGAAVGNSIAETRLREPATRMGSGQPLSPVWFDDADLAA